MLSLEHLVLEHWLLRNRNWISTLHVLERRKELWIWNETLSWRSLAGRWRGRGGQEGRDEPRGRGEILDDLQNLFEMKEELVVGLALLLELVVELALLLELELVEELVLEHLWLGNC